MIGPSNTEIADLRLKAAKTALLITRGKINIKSKEKQPPAHKKYRRALPHHTDFIASSTSMRRIRISPACKCWCETVASGFGCEFLEFLQTIYVIAFAIADCLSILDILRATKLSATRIPDEYMTCKARSAYRFILPIPHVKPSTVNGRWTSSFGPCGIQPRLQ